MKSIKILLLSFGAFGALQCFADTAVESLSGSDFSTGDVAILDSGASTELGVSDAFVAIMFEEGVQASFAGENWLAPTQVERSGLVIQRQEGSLHLQYRF